MSKNSRWTALPCGRQKGLRLFSLFLAAIIIFSGAAQGNAGSWVPMSSGITDSIAGIWGSSGNSVFVVGNYRAPGPEPPPPPAVAGGKIWHFDGSSWTQVFISGVYLRDIWGSSGADVFAVGGTGWEGAGHPYNEGIILHYNGTSWGAMIRNEIPLSGIWGSSGHDVFAVGGIYQDGFLSFPNVGKILHYDGVSWIEMPVVAPVLGGVAGSSWNDVFAVGGSGTILHYDGSSWSAMSSGTTQGLSGIWANGGNDVFAVGATGTILHYDGSSWSAMSSGTSKNLHAVWGSSGTDVFAVGSEYVSYSNTYEYIILHYDGSSWSTMTSGSGDLSGVWGSSSSDVFAAGGQTMLHYDDYPPTVVSTNPAGSANQVAVNTTVQTIFSEDLDSSTINASNFVINPVISGTVSYDKTTRTAIFAPSANLAYNTTYTATLKSGVKDLAGNPMAADYSWSFTTDAQSSGGGGGGGCFIATAAFGSFLAEEVIILQEFRDRYLLTHPAGKGMVSLYYRYSPPVANYIADHESFRAAIRIALMPVIYSIKYPMAAGLLFVVMGGGVAIIRNRRFNKEP